MITSSDTTRTPGSNPARFSQTVGFRCLLREVRPTGSPLNAGLERALPLKIGFFHTSRIADRHQIKVEDMFYAHVSLPPRPVSYSGLAAGVLPNRKSNPGRFSKSQEAVAQSQSQPQSGGRRSQCHPCGQRDSEETVQERSNCCCLPCNHARCSGTSCAVANREGRDAWSLP